MDARRPQLGRSRSADVASSALELADVTQHLLISHANVFSDCLVLGRRKAVARGQVVGATIIIQLAMQHLLVVIVLLAVCAWNYGRITGARLRC